MQCLCGYTDHADANSGVEEGLVQICPFKRWHSAIFSSFAVEEKVCGENCAAYDGAAVEEFGGHVACIWPAGLGCWLDVSAMEGIAGFGEGREW